MHEDTDLSAHRGIPVMPADGCTRVYVVHEEAPSRASLPRAGLAIDAAPFRSAAGGILFYSGTDWNVLARNSALPCVETNAALTVEMMASQENFGARVQHVTYAPMRSNALRAFLAALQHAEEEDERGACLVAFGRWTTALPASYLWQAIQNATIRASKAHISTCEPGYDLLNLLRWQDRADWCEFVSDGEGLRLFATRHAHGDQLLLVSAEGRAKLLRHPLVQRYDLLGRSTLDDVAPHVAPRPEMRAPHSLSDRLVAAARALGGVPGAQYVGEVAKSASRTITDTYRDACDGALRPGAARIPPRNALCLPEAHPSRLRDTARAIPYTRHEELSSGDADPLRVTNVARYLRSTSLDAFLHYVVRTEAGFRCLVLAPSLVAFDVASACEYGDYFKTHECLRPTEFVESNAVEAQRIEAKLAGARAPAKTYLWILIVVLVVLVIVAMLVAWIASVISSRTGVCSSCCEVLSSARVSAAPVSRKRG